MAKVVLKCCCAKLALTLINIVNDSTAINYSET